MEEEIFEAYENLDDFENEENSADELLQKTSNDIYVAVRSSATAEDLEDASFAGQQETFLNVKGKTELFEKVKRKTSIRDLLVELPT